MVSVGVNLLWCRPGEVGGSEEYLARSLVGLAVAAPDIDACLAVPPGYRDAHPELAGFDVVVGPERARRRRSARIVAESRSLHAMLGDVDVVHHAGGTMPVRPDRRQMRSATLLTIHDVQYLSHPEYFATTRRTYLRLRVPPSARRADVIAVPSEYVRSTVVAAFDGVRAERVVVVPHGVDPPDPTTIPDAATLRARYGLGDRRVLVYPAMTHPHKGHRFLIRLLADQWRDDDLVLVLLGRAGAADTEVARAIAELGVTHRVVRPGRVPAPDRDGLVALAEALVFPSEYEGFGAPILEAMALGTPVICSDRAAVPEVAGDAAVIRPLEPTAWAGALDAVTADRDDLVRRGRERAMHFTVEASGAALAAAYRRAAAR